MDISLAIRRLVLISDFNMQNLASAFCMDRNQPEITATSCSYGQLYPSLVDCEAAIWADNPDAALIWALPEAVLPTIGRALAGESVDESDVLSEVDAFSELVKEASSRVNILFIVSWAVSSPHLKSALLQNDTKSIKGLITIANQRLSERLDGVAHVLDSSRWIASVGENSFSPKLWYLAKVPYGNAIFSLVVDDVKATLLTMMGKARKLIVVDLDGTLWGGVVGDDGVGGLRLGGHDSTGEAFIDVQRILKQLKKRGFILAIVSKNNEEIALDAINRHPEMLLRGHDFVGWRINWEDKSENIVDLVKELNLGLQSVIFIDDSPFERGRVREALPEVLVLELPEDPCCFPLAIADVNRFGGISVTEEDLDRTEMYNTERQRTVSRNDFESLEEWLKTLKLQTKFDLLSTVNITRSAQLLNKTNQMNLSTRRMGENELLAWADSPENRFWAVTVSDRFGKYGLTGLISLSFKQKEAKIVDLVLSCRVMGRFVEDVMLEFAARQAKKEGCEKVVAKYIETSKNKPTHEFLKRNAIENEGRTFSFGNDYSAPASKWTSILY